MQQTQTDLLVIGGGAAGFFAAINAAEMKSDLRIIILESSQKVLSKVKISGGGRCNVTHAEYLPENLVQYYPRGEKELLGPFYKFMTGDVVAWFEQRGVPLKSEQDGRIFPVSNNSQTVIDCFMQLTTQLGIQLRTRQRVSALEYKDGKWLVDTANQRLVATRVLVASGSDKRMWNILQHLGHTIVKPLPSLFTFNIKDERIQDLPGVGVDAVVRVVSDALPGRLESSGPLLITHWGMSGPSILKLSAWGARDLAALNYHFDIAVNWLGGKPLDEVVEELKGNKQNLGKNIVIANVMFGLPRRLWQNLVRASGISKGAHWGDVTGRQIDSLAGQLTAGVFQVTGKSTFKEEFVTTGGVDLREINFRTFESRLFPGLYLAGEVLNVDALTGGFNFQNAWTGSYLAAVAITQS